MRKEGRISVGVTPSELSGDISGSIVDGMPLTEEEARARNIKRLAAKLKSGNAINVSNTIDKLHRGEKR
jgi:hypothetical protein